MRLESFIQDNPFGMKVILANKVSVGNALIRQCNLRQGVGSFNYEVKTPFDLAKQILDSIKNEHVNYLSQESEAYLMLNLLREKNSSLLPESTVTLGTSKEVLLRVNEIRENDVTQAYEGEVRKDGRIKELDSIVKSYEELLSKQNIYDKCRSLREAADFCRTKKNEVISAIPQLKGASFAELSTNRYSTAEKDFIESLVKAVNGPDAEIESIEFLSDESTAGFSFYEARGMANEIRHAAEKLKEFGKAESYGTMALYYSSPEYVSFLKAVFDVERIPYCVNQGNPAMELQLTHFFVSLLDAAEQDFSYELLGKVVRSRVITFDNVLDEKANEQENEYEDEEPEQDSSEEKPDLRDSVRVNPIKGYRSAMSAGIGWGRERYLAYYDMVMKDKDSLDEAKVFAGFLKEFVEVFDDGLSIGEMYRKLWDFVQRYTYKKNREKAILKSALQEKWDELMLIDSTGYSLQDKISFIRDMIVGMQVDDTEADDGAVSLAPLGDLFVMERKHNFILGLSSTAFLADDKQSPVLLDAEKKRYLKGAENQDTCIDLATERNARLSENLKNSLRTRMSDADVVFSYSYYDSINLRESSPSVFFTEISAGKTVETAPGYEKAPYIINEDIQISGESIETSIRDKVKGIEEKREEKRKKWLEKEGGTKEADKEKKPEDKNVYLSASGIQTMLKCPFMYYYQYVKGLRMDEPKAPKGHEWLDAANKGNLCHYFMEKYMSEAKDPASGIEEQLFERAFKESAAEIEAVQPAFSEVIKEKEKEYYKNKIRGYLEFLQKEWEKDRNACKSWKVIDCELPFGKKDESGQVQPVCFDNKVGYSCIMNGSIDRVDGYVDAAGKLKLRIIDYKTGSKSGKEKEINEGVQIQHNVYAYALNTYLDSDIGKKRVKELFGREFNRTEGEVQYEWVGYTFPYEEKDEDRVLNVFSDKEAIADFTKDINYEVDYIIGSHIAGKFDDLAKEMEKAFVKKRISRWEHYLEEKEAYKDDKSRNKPKDIISVTENGKEMISLSDFCSNNYCKYQQICRKWMGYREESAEEDEE